LALLIAIGVVLQAMFIAVAWFAALKDLDGGAVINKDTSENFGRVMHGVFGSIVIPLIALALLVVAFFAHVDSGSSGLCTSSGWSCCRSCWRSSRSVRRCRAAAWSERVRTGSGGEPGSPSGRKCSAVGR